MEELKKISNPMTVREFLNTLSNIEFSAFVYHRILQLLKNCSTPRLDDFDIEFDIECDFSTWLDSLYCEDKELLPVVKLSIYDDEEIENLDD